MARFVMRYAKDSLFGQRAPSDEVQFAFQRILELSEPLADIQSIFTATSSIRSSTSSVSLIRAREHKVKGIITTTSDFPPNIMKDPFIAPFVPYRLELMNGKALQEWLKKLAERT